MSCESWKRRQDAGTINLCDGSWYIVFVLNTTGIEGCVAVDEDAAIGEVVDCNEKVASIDFFRPGPTIRVEWTSRWT